MIIMYADKLDDELDSFAQNLLDRYDVYHKDIISVGAAKLNGDNVGYVVVVFYIYLDFVSAAIFSFEQGKPAEIKYFHTHAFEDTLMAISAYYDFVFVKAEPETIKKFVSEIKEVASMAKTSKNQLGAIGKILYKGAKLGVKATKKAIEKGKEFTVKTGKVYREIGESMNPHTLLDYTTEYGEVIPLWDKEGEDFIVSLISFAFSKHSALKNDAIDMIIKMKVLSKVNPAFPKKLEESEQWNKILNALELKYMRKGDTLYIEVPDFIRIPYAVKKKKRVSYKVVNGYMALAKDFDVDAKYHFQDITFLQIHHDKEFGYNVQLSKDTNIINKIFVLSGRLYGSSIKMYGVPLMRGLSITLQGNKGKFWIAPIPLSVIAHSTYHELHAYVRNINDKGYPYPPMDTNEMYELLRMYHGIISTKIMLDGIFKQFLHHVINAFPPNYVMYMINRAINESSEVKKNPTSKDFIKKATRVMGVANYMLRNGTIGRKEYDEIRKQVEDGLRNWDWEKISHLYSQFIDQFRGYAHFDEFNEAKENIERVMKKGGIMRNPKRKRNVITAADGTVFHLVDDTYRLERYKARVKRDGLEFCIYANISYGTYVKFWDGYISAGECDKVQVYIKEKVVRPTKSRKEAREKLYSVIMNFNLDRFLEKHKKGFEFMVNSMAESKENPPREFVYLAKGTEIALKNGKVIKFSKKPLMLKPKGRNELWFVFPDYKKKGEFKPDERAISEFEMFNMTDYDGNNFVIGISVDLSRLKRIGEVVYEGYLSDKEGTLIRYLHEHHKPLPVLYSDSEGKVFIIKGGMLKIKDWLYK